MATQTEAAELYREIQDASAEAWAGAATRATANMHPYSPEWDEDEAQAAWLRDWRAEHPQAPRRPGRWLAQFGALCLLGVGLGAGLSGVYRVATRHDALGLAAAVVGWLIVYLVWRAWRAR